MVLLSDLSLAARAENPAGACRLLSKADVEQALHLATNNGDTRVNTDALTSCTYRAPSGGTVSILVRRHASRAWIGEQLKRMNSGSGFRPIDGVGDAAFVLDLRQSGVALCVFQGDYYIEICVVRLGAADSVLPATQKLARKALSRLAGSTE
jgi:hypothetical protein